MSQTHAGSAASLSQVWSEDHQLFRAVVESLPIGVYLCDPENRITFFNSKAASLWGRSPQIGDVCPLLESRTSDLNEGFEFTIERPGKGEILALGAISELQHGGRSVGTLVTFQELPARSSEERYRTIFESSGAGILVVRDGVYAEANTAACRMLARSPGDLIGRRPEDLIPGARKDHFKRIGAILEGRGHWSGEIAFDRPDGLWAWLSMDASILPGTSDVLAVVQDISDRKAVEAKARESDELFGIAMDSLPALISYVDCDLRYRFINKAYEDWFGQSREQILGRPIEEVLGPVAFQKIQPNLARAMRGEAFSLETYLDYLHLGRRYVRVNYSPRTDASGQVVGVFALVFDLSDKWQAQEALERSEEEFRAIFEHASSGKAKSDAQTGKFLRVNRAFCEITGYKEDELQGMSSLDVTHPDYREKESQLLERLRKGEIDTWQTEKRYLRKDGRAPVVLVTGRLIRDAAGQPLNTVATITDVTELREAQRALQEAERRAQAAMKAGRVGTWFWDIATGRVEWSDHLYEIHGISPEEFGGDVEAFRSLIYPDDLPQIEAALQRALEHDSEYKLDFRAVRPSGEVRWLSTEAQVQRDADGKPISMLGATSDITERKTAEVQLRDAIEQFRLLAETSPSFIWMSDTEGNLKFMSPGWTAYTGLAIEDTRPRLQEVVHPDDWRSAKDARDRSRERVEPFSTEFRVRCQHDGEYRWFVNHGVPHRDEEGRLVGWLGVTADIHDRKTEQERLERLVAERTAELEAANAEMESFSYSVSHDLRAPLRAIVSTSRILAEDYGARLPREAHELIARQSSAANKLAQLIDDLLKLSRLGRQELERQPLDLSEIAHSLAQELGHKREHGVKFVISQNLRAKGDPHLVRFLLQNLMENAEKFSPDGGEVEVGCSKGIFFVRDHGIGLDMQYAHKIFLPFERLVRDVDFPGTGIGLATVKQIVDRHGGRVWVESELGQGATFYFTLG